MVPPERDRFVARSYVESNLLAATRPSAAYGSEVACAVDDATLWADGICTLEGDGAPRPDANGDAEPVSAPSGVATGAVT